jgi:hypothetical protein
MTEKEIILYIADDLIHELRKEIYLKDFQDLKE